MHHFSFLLDSWHWRLCVMLMRYLENMLIRQNSIHSSTELIQHLNVIDSSVRTYKFPSEKDMKHINRKLRSCWGLSSHDDSKK
ncbi:cyclin-H1-1-like isoform X3 [Eucalyptus grandis]|uniref:cyclin-H1-1-like isoform X3 n=1 Tax=Eucalyptus grandis TaxID=71139 RepID=UPI00192EFAEA|nr:cyclin-H1-1-like isoform X3 [Eucalyptus grandis]